MSLLPTPENVSDLAHRVYERQFALDPQLEREYDDRQKRLMYNDILYNLSYLDTALQLNDEGIFTDYAVWLYQLLCHLMPALDRARLKAQMVLHYQVLADALAGVLPEAKAQQARQYLQSAMAVTERESVSFSELRRPGSSAYQEVKTEYLAHLLRGNTRAALAVIERTAQAGVPLQDIYLHILQDVMYEVGHLWHQHKLTVDREHYITSTTQMALSQFFPVIFSRPRNHHKVLTCAVGSELHELGIRMVSDMFEYHGWDSIYLGAAVPPEGILNAIQENQPDLVALSVTMPQHLPLCAEAVRAIRARYPAIKIAVGGRAFQSTRDVWQAWGADVHTENAEQLVAWADQQLLRPDGA